MDELDYRARDAVPETGATAGDGSGLTVPRHDCATYCLRCKARAFGALRRLAESCGV